MQVLHTIEEGYNKSSLVKMALTLCLGVVVFLFGCKERVEGVAPSLKVLENVFGVTWPKSYTHDYGASSTYNALLDARSSHEVILARFETDRDSYFAWKTLTAATLEEFPRWIPYRNDSLADKYPWWDLDKYSENRVITRFSSRIQTNTIEMARLDIDVVAVNERYIFYIDASIKTR